MFKKAVEAKSQQRLSGADRKKLRRTVRDRFPYASDADIDALLPPKAEITISKFPNRILVYGLEGGYPMFFDTDGRGQDIFPTVYALWKAPDLLPAFWLKGGEVSRYVIGGADLMFPGIYIPLEGLPNFSAGEPWAVKVPGNPAPIAVGLTTMGCDEALKASLRGKALKICHFYRDTLWENVENPYVPNAGFLEDVVYEDPSSIMASEVSDSLEGDEDGIASYKEVGDALDFKEDPHTPCSTGLTNMETEGTEQLISSMGGVRVIETAEADELDNTEEQHPLSVEEVDELLYKYLLQALHTTVKDDDLPISGSTLWSGHVLPCRPPGVTVDVKKSSFKKLSKWLLAKAASGLISVKEDKHKKEVNLFAVNRSHPDYVSFRPEKKKVVKGGQSSTEQGTVEGQSPKVFEVTEVYRPSHYVNPIFISVGADMGKIYSKNEASQIAFQYVEKENLVKPTDKSRVILDGALCDALFKGAIKKGSSYPTEIPKQELVSTFISRMQAHHKVTRDGETVVRKGHLRPIQIMTERRQGNKKVTKLSGLESFLIDSEAMSSELQKKFACSTTVAELPGKKGLEVLVQGGVIDVLAKHLIEQYKIPRKCIEVLDKTKK
ncbi:OLC1v1018531C1 [Oldenlandia corymbosa var. corymbosa]|uniref:OLC1v1018531C1 n=1 Tax=Oldenlandia corymbosa var. corymbosa TaxID=529605 RepID=A0AAV1EBX4_OLDCO|nr:OLC1v1018531C1 [Oldenlandia corymbosa var. corymbosa]